MFKMGEVRFIVLLIGKRRLYTFGLLKESLRSPLEKLGSISMMDVSRWASRCVQPGERTIERETIERERDLPGISSTETTDDLGTTVVSNLSGGHTSEDVWIEMGMVCLTTPTFTERSEIVHCNS